MSNLFRLIDVILTLALLAILWLEQTSWAQSSREADEPQPTLFRDPPMSARPRGMWVWPNGITSLSRITYELEEMKAKGLGGFDIWDVGLHIDRNEVLPEGPVFMEGEMIAAVGHAVREGKRLGLEMGMNVTNTMAEARYGAIGLHRSHRDVSGPQAFAGRLPFPEVQRRHKRTPPLLTRDDRGRPLPFEEVAVIAIRLDADGKPAEPQTAISLSENMNVDGLLKWQVPEGTWRITRYVAAPTGEAGLFIRPGAMGRTPDFFSAEATEAHFGWYLDRLQAELGPLNETAMKYFFLESYELKDALWTFGFPEMFRKRNGYDIVPLLPALDGVVMKSKETTARFLHDYRSTLSQLAIKNHFAKGQSILEKHGIDYVAEAGGPGPPVHEVPFSDLPALGALDFTRGEFWYREDEPMNLQIIKGPASAAHLYNKPFVEAESFTGVLLWQKAPNSLRRVADRAFAEGLNRIVYHVSAHTPWESGQPGWVYPFGSLMYPGLAWWPKSQPWHRYLARVSYLMQRGHFVGDVLYFYGDQTPQFVKPKHIREGLGPGYDYDLVNTEIIRNRLDVRDGRLVLPHGQSYRILVLPDQDAIEPETLAAIEQLVLKGATVIGKKPTRSHGLHRREERDETVREIRAPMWGAAYRADQAGRHDHGNGVVLWGVSPRTELISRGVGPDFVGEVPAAASPLDYIHRRTDEADIYFVRNRDNDFVDAGLTFRIAGRKPEFWHAETGEVEPVLVYQSTADGVQMPVTFGPHDSVAVVFRNHKPGNHKPEPHWTSIRPKDPASAGGHANAADSPRSPLDTQHGRITAWTAGEWTLEGTDQAQQTVVIDSLPAAQPVKGPWRVRFPIGWGNPPRVELPELVSWADHPEHRVRHFSGSAAYHQTFELGEASLESSSVVRLELGDVREIADVWVNGHHLGILWHPPYSIDITDAVRAGPNQLVVEVSNVLNNRLIGDAQRPEEYRQASSNISSVPTAWASPWAKGKLVESGLLGPVTVRFGKNLSSPTKGHADPTSFSNPNLPARRLHLKCSN